MKKLIFSSCLAMSLLSGAVFAQPIHDRAVIPVAVVARRARPAGLYSPLGISPPIAIPAGAVGGAAVSFVPVAAPVSQA